MALSALARKEDQHGDSHRRDSQKHKDEDEAAVVAGYGIRRIRLRGFGGLDVFHNGKAQIGRACPEHHGDLMLAHSQGFQYGRIQSKASGGRIQCVVLFRERLAVDLHAGDRGIIHRDLQAGLGALGPALVATDLVGQYVAVLKIEAVADGTALAAGLPVGRLLRVGRSGTQRLLADRLYGEVVAGGGDGLRLGVGVGLALEGDGSGVGAQAVLGAGGSLGHLAGDCGGFRFDMAAVICAGEGRRGGGIATPAPGGRAVVVAGGGDGQSFQCSFVHARYRQCGRRWKWSRRQGP